MSEPTCLSQAQVIRPCTCQDEQASERANERTNVLFHFVRPICLRSAVAGPQQLECCNSLAAMLARPLYSCQLKSIIFNLLL